MDRIKRLISAWGIAFHSCMSAIRKAWRVVGGWGQLRMRLSKTSHKCSIGERSGLYGGLCIKSTLFCWRNAMLSLATCAQALSCWNVTLCCRTYEQLPVVKRRQRNAEPSNIHQWIPGAFYDHKICQPTPSTHRLQIDHVQPNNCHDNALRHAYTHVDGRQVCTTSMKVNRKMIFQSTWWLHENLLG